MMAGGGNPIFTPKILVVNIQNFEAKAIIRLGFVQTTFLLIWHKLVLACEIWYRTVILKFYLKNVSISCCGGVN
jgi:hypothetical protein